jgi:hypothetical protein
MPSTRSICLNVLLGVISCTLFLSCADSRKGTTTVSGPITESKAIELARKEAAKDGDKVQDYEVRIVNNTNTEEWSVFFELPAFNTNVGFANPIGKDFIITVNKKTGHTVLMPGE